MARTLKIRSNNWHPGWYPVLECIARRVIRTVQANTGVCGVEIEDLISCGWRTAARYRPPERDGLSGCATNIKRNMLKYVYKQFNKEKKYGVTIYELEINAEALTKGTYHDDYDLIDIQDEIDMIADDRIKRIITLSLMGMTCKEIGNELGISGERVRQLKYKFATEKDAGRMTLCH